MEAEPLHDRLRRFRFVASAAIYKPVDFDGWKLLESFEEVGYGGILDWDYKLVEVDECYPSGVEAVAFEAVVVGGKLSSVARPVDILDNTLLDFYAIEDHILGKALSMNGITPTPEVIARYQDINMAQWLLLEQGELELEEVGVRRFELLVNEINPAVDAKVLSDTYDHLMEDACFLVPGAEALLQELHS